MPKVKTLRWHRNVHGVHEVGDVYQHDRPASDVHFGLVEIIKPTVPELKEKAANRNIELPKEGSGKSGGIVKADIVEAIEKA